MKLKKTHGRRILLLTLAIGSLAVLAISSTAYATHPRPKSATPMTFRLVLAFNQCTSPSGNHNPPLALPSCIPVQTSSFLTMNAPDRVAPFNQPATFAGYVIQKWVSTPDINVTVSTSGGGVRCVGVGGQALCSGGPASTYNGKVLVEKTLRITDHANNIPGCPPNCPGTMTDFPLQVGVQCNLGDCNIATSFNGVIPGMIATGFRAVIEEGQLQVQDAGLNGNLVAAGPPTSGVCPPACTQDDPATLYMVQGMFAP
jgi:hypothetical protein